MLPTSAAQDKTVVLWAVGEALTSIVFGTHCTLQYIHAKTVMHSGQHGPACNVSMAYRRATCCIAAPCTVCNRHRYFYVQLCRLTGASMLPMQWTFVCMLSPMPSCMSKSCGLQVYACCRFHAWYVMDLCHMLQCLQVQSQGVPLQQS